MSRKIFSWFISLLFVSQSFAAIDFDGTDDYVDLGTVLNPLAITVSVWIKPATLTNAYQSIYDRQNPGATLYTELFVKSNGKLASYISTSGGGAFYDGTGVHTLSAGTWYHLALVYDSTVGLIAYVNGVLDGAFAATGTLDTNTLNTYIGKSPVFASREFDGLMDDVRIYNRVLSANELQTIVLSRNRTTISSGLIGHWKMSEFAEGASADGATIPDRSGTGNNGTGVDGANNTGLTGAETILGNPGGHN